MGYVDRPKRYNLFTSSLTLNAQCCNPHATGRSVLVDLGEKTIQSHSSRSGLHPIQGNRAVFDRFPTNGHSRVFHLKCYIERSRDALYVKAGI